MQDNVETTMIKVNLINNIYSNIKDNIQADNKESNARYNKIIVILTEKIDIILKDLKNYLL